jgi:hypothetical protein
MRKCLAVVAIVVALAGCSGRILLSVKLDLAEDILYLAQKPPDPSAYNSLILGDRNSRLQTAQNHLSLLKNEVRGESKFRGGNLPQRF